MSDTPIADMVEKLLAGGVSHETIVFAVRSIETARSGASYDSPRKAKDRERAQRYRDHRRANGMSTYFRGDMFRADLMRRDGANCVYCGKEPGAHIDHFQPISKGGTDALDNLGLTCRPCNSGKGGRTPDEARMTFASPTAQEAYQRYLTAITRVDGTRQIADEGADDERMFAVKHSVSSSSFLPLKKEETEEVSKKVSVVERAPRAKRKTAVALPDDWQPKSTHYDAAKKLNLTAEFVDRKADDMRIWAKSNDNRKVDWDMTFHGFLRRDGGRNGFGGSRPLQDDSRSVSRAAGRLAEKAERGEFQFGPRPRLVPEENPDPVRLLSKG